MKKKIVIGMVVGAAIPALMWLYGFVGTGVKFIEPVDVVNMNCISKHGSKTMAQLCGWDTSIYKMRLDKSLF